MSEHLIKSNDDQQIVMDITPESANWDYLSYRIVRLQSGETYTHQTEGTEIALVPIEGSATLRVGGQSFDVARKGVFEELPHVLYTPPQQTVTVKASSTFEFAIGSAPAEGKYPIRLFRPDEMKVEVRGGGAATRQVNHILAHPLPAERLILFEVYVPGGAWSGYPPHCHDGYGDSAYLEETYYFRMTPENGFGFHRNYRVDTDFDETFVIKNKDCVLVTQGFHSTAAAPEANIYFLNYLAGDLLDEARGTPPYDDPEYAYLRGNLDGKAKSLPMVGKETE
ncbi:MAG: 5-deoxy-glucuronate isomerase [Phototrophicaceae bacterium]